MKSPEATAIGIKKRGREEKNGSWGGIKRNKLGSKRAGETSFEFSSFLLLAPSDRLSVRLADQLLHPALTS